MSQAPPPPPPAAAGGTGTVGNLRKPLTVALLTIVTCGIYGLWWYYRNFEDMKQNTGEGVGGGVGLLLAIFCSIIAVFLLPAEVGNLYEREGKEKPVSAITGLWNLLPIVGFFIFVFKVQDALNDYWGPKGGTWATKAPE
jgi:hypothetical protein